MSQTLSWKITITSDPNTMSKLDKLPSHQQTELNQKIATAIAELVGQTSPVQVTLSPESDVLADHTKRYDASSQLVQVITSDFEGTLYPFALTLGKHVEAFIQRLVASGHLSSRIHTLDTEMHQMITEIARHYARTGKWHVPEEF